MLPLARADAWPPGSAAETPERVPRAQVVAEQVAAQAALAEPTPIVRGPGASELPAFQLYAEYDLPVLGVGLVFAASRLVREQPAYCAPLCDKADLNPIDRTTAGYWSPAWRLTSDLGLVALMGAAGTLLLVDEGFSNALNDGVVVAESALASIATVSIMTLAASRPRPFLYGEDAPLKDRKSSDASLSFLSSHASVAFAIATSSFITSRRLHPSGKLPFLVLGAGGAMAALVAVSRVFAGRHFISDALGGAIVGTSLGVLVPSLHGSPLRLVPSAAADRAELSLVGRF